MRYYYYLIMVTLCLFCSNPVNTTTDNLVIDAGENRDAGINETIVLIGTVSDNERAIRYEWKTGENDWVITSGTDISITIPPTAGSLTCYFRVTDRNGIQEVDSLVVTVNTQDLFVRYNVPSVQQLQSITSHYEKIETTGLNPPDLSSATSFAFSYYAQGDVLYQFSFNFDKEPFYRSLTASITFQFSTPGPQFTLTGSGVSGLDGTYYICGDSDRLVWVSSTGQFAIVFTP